MITEQQSEMIDYLIQGENKSNIAKLLGVSRQTVHTWSNLSEVKAEKQKRLRDIKTSARNRIATKVDNCIDIIYDIAIKSKDTRTKFAAAKYLCDQFIGSPSAEKTIEEEKDKTIEVSLVDEIDIDATLEKIEKQKAEKGLKK